MVATFFPFIFFLFGKYDRRFFADGTSRTLFFFSVPNRLLLLLLERTITFLEIF